MIGSIFVYETLAKTLLYLGADHVAMYDEHGYNLLPHRPGPGDPWVQQQVDAAYSFLVATRPIVGAQFTDRAVRILPLPAHASRVVMAVVPGGYVIAHLPGLENWLSDLLARKFADAIEQWVAENRNPYFSFYRPWPPARFYR